MDVFFCILTGIWSTDIDNVCNFWIGLDLVFNATFNNISDRSVWTVYMLAETGVPGETYRPVASY